MNKSVPFNKFYRLFNIISSLLIVLSIVLLIFKGLNFGVDFKGGTLIELRTTDKNISVSNIRDSLNQLNLGDVDDDFLLNLKFIYNNKFEKKKNSDLLYFFMLVLNQICNNKFFTVYDYRIKIHSIIKKYKYLKYPVILFDPFFLFKKLLNPLGFLKIKKFLKGEILKKISKSSFYSQFYK